jgi:DDE_Tnp_1-associated
MRTRRVRYEAPDGSLRAALETVPDVRRGQGRVHSLGGMLALSVCALLCGSRSRYAISQWGRECAPEIRVALGLRAERGPSGDRACRRCIGRFAPSTTLRSSGS